MRSLILFLSGHHEDARELTRMLQDLPIVVEYAGSLQQARTKLQRETYEVVLTEAALPDGNWLDALEMARASANEPRVIVTDPKADARLWAEALNLGAYDLLVQPFYPSEVRRILSNACSLVLEQDVLAAV
jgi:two-component system, NtrC family, response regulator PilR